MKKVIKIISLPDSNENEVVIRLGEFEITCFIAYAPYQLVINKEYSAEISLYFVNDDLSILESELKPNFYKLDEGYKYAVVGKINNESLVINDVCLNSDSFLNAYDFNGKNVIIEADRIDIAFL